MAHSERSGMDISHPMGKGGLPFLLFPDIIAERLAERMYSFSFFGIQHEPSPNITHLIPITQETDVVLLGVRSVQARNLWPPDRDSKNRFVKVNKLNHPVLYFHEPKEGTPYWADLDFNIYANFSNGRIVDLNNNVILNRPLKDGEHLYINPQGQVYSRFERPHPISRKEPKIIPSIKVKVKDGLNWLNGGITEVTNGALIQPGEIVKAKIISAKSKGAWSNKTVKCTVDGNKRRWFIIQRMNDVNPPLNAGRWNVRVHAAEFNFIVKPEESRAMIYADLGEGEISLGVLALDCDVVPLGRSINAQIVYEPSRAREILLSPS